MTRARRGRRAGEPHPPPTPNRADARRVAEARRRRAERRAAKAGARAEAGEAARTEGARARVAAAWRALDAAHTPAERRDALVELQRVARVLRDVDTAAWPRARLHKLRREAS